MDRITGSFEKCRGIVPKPDKISRFSWIFMANVLLYLASCSLFVDKLHERFLAREKIELPGPVWKKLAKNWFDAV